MIIAIIKNRSKTHPINFTTQPGVFLAIEYGICKVNLVRLPNSSPNHMSNNDPNVEIKQNKKESWPFKIKTNVKLIIDTIKDRSLSIVIIYIFYYQF